MTGLELEDAAHKAGVSPDRLERWESGDLRPTITQLRKLSGIYKRPLAVFFMEEPPADETPPSDFRRFDPDAAEPLSPALRLAIREARARRDAALELLTELDERPPEFRLAVRVTENPEHVGTQLRETLTGGLSPRRCGEYSFLNFWRAAIEDVGALVFQAEGVHVEEMRGFSIAERPLPAIVLNLKDAPTGRCFSLLHEMAHVMVNRGGLCLFDETGPRTDVQRMEVFCNHVAGAALVPAELLLREPETPRAYVREIPNEAVTAIARRYGTSDEVVLRRLVILNRVPLAFYQRKREAYRQQYEQLRQLRRESGFALPHTMSVATAGKRFTRLVLAAYDEDRITASDVSEHLGVRLKHLGRIREAVQEEPIAGEPS